MGQTAGNGRDRNRTLLAQEAARIMAREGVRDFGVAKRKAAQRLSLPLSGAMPSNVEIDAALREYQRLFMSEDQPQRLLELRRCAIDAMEFFGRFRPRLVGAVLRGTAGEHSGVTLHLFADTPEDVVLFLMEQQIPYDEYERRFRLNGNGHQQYPAYRFAADDIDVELVVFPSDSERQAPWSPVDGKPMQRADVETVRRLIV